jgi:hypothetical protein
MVNLDTGTALALVSEGSPLRHLLKATIGNSPMVMCLTAVAEFQRIVQTVGGPLEQGRAGGRDIIVFGTGDQLGVMTVSADAKFVRGAAAQGVHFNLFVHPPVPLTGA